MDSLPISSSYLKPVEILLVEDSPTDRLITLEALSGSRLLNSLNVVENGVDALDYLHRRGKFSNAPRPDLILLDLNLPKKDGREVLAEIKQDPFLKYIPVIVLTTSESSDDILKAYGDHANSYITKPVDFARFSQGLEALGNYWFRVVTLPPYLARTVDRGEVAAAKQPVAEGQKRRILLVEDSDIDGFLLEDALQEYAALKFDLTRADRLATAEEFLQQQSFDLIITDLGLPETQGLDTYRRLKSLSNLPIIVLTGLEDELIGETALQEGAQDYLVKGQLGGKALGRSIRYAIERHELRTQLTRVQHMEAVGQLAGGVAHDFNNLLTVVQCHAHLLRDIVGDQEEAKEMVEAILASSEKAASLTRQLLTFSRRQVMTRKPLDLNSLVGEFTLILRRILGAPIHVELQLSQGQLGISADVGMLELVLMNLAVNARDAMPAGGKLTLATFGPMRVARVGRVDQEMDCVCLRVSDTGCGIEATDLARIFEPFFSTKEIGIGTGLGLATAYSIVDQHGGWIEVESALHHGTTFCLYLPFEVKQNSEPGPMEEIPASQGKGQLLMVLEDEEAVREIAVRQLRRQGYQVLEAAGASEAYQLAEQFGSQIVLLFSDMVLPESSGREIAQALVERIPGLEVVYTSGYSPDFVSRDLGLREGENFLPKPYNSQSLLAIIQGALGRARGPV